MSDNISEAMGVVTGILILVLALSVTTYLFTEFNNNAIKTYENQLKVSNGSLVDSGDFNINLFNTANKDEGKDKTLISLDQKIVNKAEVLAMIERYSKENFSVKLVDNDNKTIKQVFDLNLERRVRNITGKKDLKGYDKKINEVYGTPGKPTYMFNAPWLASGDDLNRNRDAFVRERLDLYANGKKGYINDQLVDYTDNFFIKLEDKRTFTEYLVKYQYSGDVKIDRDSSDGNYKEQIVTGSAPTYKVEIIYVLNK